MERRLAAILATDVVGYSRLMGKDEAGTRQALRAHREELIEPKIAEHDGRIVELIGAGLLAEFPSAVEAVHCAIEVQQKMGDRNVGVPEERRITYRMEINIGDVIVERDDNHGDGVNVAAWLEALAQPGGVCISRTVFNHMKAKVESGFEDLGEQQFKNTAEPVQEPKPEHHHPRSAHPNKSTRRARHGRNINFHAGSRAFRGQALAFHPTDTANQQAEGLPMNYPTLPYLPVLRTSASLGPVMKELRSRRLHSTAAHPAGSGKQCLPSTYDVWQAALLLIGLYGTEAVDYAAQRRKDVDDRGDRTGAATWGLISSQIERVLRGAPLSQMN